MDTMGSRRLASLSLLIILAAGCVREQVPTSQQKPVAPAASPADADRIAFCSNRDGNFEIYVMNADGSAPLRLTNDPAEDTSPVWSPDGRRIAFERRDERHCNESIWVMDEDGGNLARLATGWDPAWSPDGSRIAWSSSGRLCVINADASGEVTEVNGPYSATRLARRRAWSPDASRLVFTARMEDADELDGDQIYIANSDGTGLVQVTDLDDWCSSAQWVPGSSKIAFCICESRRSGIYTMNPDGGDLTRITEPCVSSMLWSPDGATIAWTGYRDGPHISWSNGRERARLGYGDPGSLDWSPDGKRLVFSAYYRDGENVYVINGDGCELAKLTHTTGRPRSTQNICPMWRPRVPESASAD